MATLSRSQLFDLGVRLRRNTTRLDLLDYIDGTMLLLTQKAECPEYAKRRQIKAQAMKRWARQESCERFLLPLQGPEPFFQGDPRHAGPLTKSRLPF